jgi:hypothetical protein
MEILRYIRDEFNYIPMVYRIESLEYRIRDLEGQICVLNCKTMNTYERENKLDNSLMKLCDALKTLGIESYSADDIRFQLKEALKWSY